MELPEWLPEEVWEEWINYRRTEKKKTASQTSQRITINKLAKLREQGYCPIKLIEHAMEFEWQGIYANENCKHEKSGRTSERIPRSAVDRVRMANAAALETDGESLAPHDGDVRAQVGDGTRGAAHGNVVEGAFRVVGRAD